MTVRIEPGYMEAGDARARILHVGTSQPFAVDAGGTTDQSTIVGAETNIENGLTVDRYQPNKPGTIGSPWALRVDAVAGDQDIDCVCIGATNWSSANQNLTIQVLGTTGFFTIVSQDITPIDNSPVMVFFPSRNTSAIRITGYGSVAPILYNLMFGKALTMQRPFYGGFSPARMARNTQVLGNLSGTGELLGRSVKRTVLRTNYNWSNLTYDWVRANLDAPLGLIQSVEAKQAYISWRPETGDCDYLMRAETNPPQAQGQTNLWTFGMTAESYAYE